MTLTFSKSLPIIAGDFNLILNTGIDCFNYVNPNQHPKARE